MISIEAYRSSIGNFYPKAVCRPIRRKFKFYKHHADKHFSFLHTGGMFQFYFHVILGLAIISAPISLDMSVVFLKLLLLLLAGDVETNPGPVNDIELEKALIDSRHLAEIESDRHAL